MTVEHFDVLIVGAGLSGIGAACHLKTKCPDRTFAIVEARDAIGGTWDLFRYPGVRSDSDMFTLGYGFRPWTDAKAIADGPSILNYIRDTAHEYAINRQIRFNHRITRASWSSQSQQWTVEAARGDGEAPAELTCNFLVMASGYYSYTNPYAPDFPGAAEFEGRIVHPQNWSSDIDCAGKNVVIVGSGATAVTLAPELAKIAHSVTLLQRSPTYIVAWPDRDRVADVMRRILPARIAHALARWKNQATSAYFFRLSRRNPKRAKAMIRDGAVKTLGPGYDIATHFTPHYNPWEQRLCLAPNDDFFQAIAEGHLKMATGAIDRFTESGIALASGQTLDADLVVTATGLSLQLLGGAALDVDGRPVDVSQHVSYKGVMLSDIPNCVSVFGYTNASWTLKADLISGFVCRLLNHMRANGFTSCTPRLSDPSMPRLPAVDFSSGYFQRALNRLPSQGSRKPWRINQSYLRDIRDIRFGSFDDGTLEFATRTRQGVGGGSSERVLR